MGPRRSKRTGNRLLDALPSRERDQVLSDLEEVSLQVKDRVWEQNEAITHVLFPRSGVVSITTMMSDGQVVEIATVGNEGMVGVPVFLGVSSMNAQAFCQVPGAAWRMESVALREQVAKGGGLHRVVELYAQALFTQIAQTTACNRLHSIEERCSRWLLETHDRARSDVFPLTQEFLAQMLGVRRATVNVAAGALQRAGFIRYRRGRITIVDRVGLESSSCECYAVVRSELERLLPPAHKFGQTRGVQRQ